MSLKVKDVSKHLFKNGKTDNHYHVNIKGKDINYIIINTLRRICLQLIPVHAFHPEDVEISVNTSVYNNDIIRLRLSNFPIYGMENNIELVDQVNEIENNKYTEESLDKLSIFFSKKNETSGIINLTTDDCEFYMGDKKIKSIYKNPLLIVRLNPLQEIRGSCKSSVGVQLTNGIYSAVQACCYEELKDNEYLFKVESCGEISEKDILRRACMVIDKKIDTFKNKFADTQIEGNKLELTLKNEDHTFGRLITYFLQNHKATTYAGGRMDHPLNREFDIVLESNGSKKLKSIIMESFNEIQSLYKKIRTSIK
jgi:DNA-directed RNA polymerase subunit L